MTALVVVVGVLLIGLPLWDAFSTMVLPRTVFAGYRPAHILFQVNWWVWRSIGNQIGNRRARQGFTAFFGPLSVFLLLIFWAGTIIIAFTLLHIGLHTQVQGPPGTNRVITLLYLSGSTFFTLGPGDVNVQNQLGWLLATCEVAIGFVFLGMIISYLPLLEQAYSQREIGILLLESRAGSPQSAAQLLRRFANSKNSGELESMLGEAERWAAELLQSHIAHPVLSFYRSQHIGQSWLTSLTTLLDSCALLIVGIKDVSPRQARITFRMALRTVRDLSRILHVPSTVEVTDRLPTEQFFQLSTLLESSGIILDTSAEAQAKLSALRRLYEPHVTALAHHLMLAVAPWLPMADRDGDWLEIPLLDDLPPR